ncbi:MAG: glycoside hydrolase family 88 protein, partial [Acidobacteriaceae bacterium]
ACGMLLLAVPATIAAQNSASAALARRIADSTLQRGSNEPSAILLNGMDAEWYNTADGRYYRYVQTLLDANAGAKTPPAELASQVLLLCRVTQKDAWCRSAALLDSQLPAAKDMTAEEAYTAEPFLAEYAAVFHRDGDFAIIAAQIRQAGRNPGPRNLGFRMMTLASALPWFPKNAAGRAAAMASFRQLAATAARSQDPASGLWPDDLKPRAGDSSSLDTAGSAMVTYSLARGVRLGLLPRRYATVAERAWQGILSRSAELPASGDQLSAGALLLAANEMRLYPDSEMDLGSRVVVDGWYNSETRKNAAGETVLFHYKWDDYSNPGFSLLGHIFRSFGVATDTLAIAPTMANLAGARFYMIVSPDNRSKTPDPHFMTAEDAGQIAAWVKQGGVLILMENDPGNADIPHLDILADRFGLHFNNVLTHHVVGDDFAMGRIDDTQTGPPFFHPRTLYMKDTCSLKLSKGAVPLLTWEGDILMAKAAYGRGTVVAVTDPWLYNEYTDGRKLPSNYQNFEAGRDFVRWLLQQK